MFIESNNIRIFQIAILVLWILSASSSAYSQETQESMASTTQRRDESSRSWQIGTLFAGGFVPSYRIHNQFLQYGIDLQFFNAGFQGGKMLTATHGPGMLRGRGEAVVEILPFWLANYPKQNRVIHFTGSSSTATAEFAGYQSYGASITPALFRWNFRPVLTRNERPIVPWAQLGGGLLWTNHKFPLLGGITSVINFTPQAAIGQSLFLTMNQSLDFAVKVVHISSAGLGDKNPGINATLQFSAGYSWWK